MVFSRLVLRVGMVLVAVITVMTWGVQAISPQGPELVYMANVDFNYDLFVLDLRTGATHALTHTPRRNERYPAYSPDGETIAYHTNIGGTYEIYMMDADGRNPHPVPLTLQLDTLDEAMVDWSPDGERIGFHAGSNAQGFNLYVADADGEFYVPLTQGIDEDLVYFTWSPDGETIALSRLASPPTVSMGDTLYLLDISDSLGSPRENIQRLQPIAESGLFPAWSPDGSQIAYVSNAGTDDEIMVLDLETGESRNLTDNSFITDTHPEWSSDGKTLYFASDRANGLGYLDVYQMDADGGNVRRLTWEENYAQAPDYRP